MGWGGRTVIGIGFLKWGLHIDWLLASTMIRYFGRRLIAKFETC